MAKVISTGEARDALHRIAKGFDAGEGEPVYFVSHRRAQAVIVPVDVWERLLEPFEDDIDLALVRERLVKDSGRRLRQADLQDAFRQATANASPRQPA